MRTSPSTIARSAGTSRTSIPAHDARGFAVDDLLAPDIETNLVNSVLTNGARYYVDHAHPEISTPECLTALEVVRYDRAAEEIIRESMAAAASHLPPDAEILCHKNNSDGKGNSYGCHENYLLARAVPFGRIVDASDAALRHAPDRDRRRQGRVRAAGHVCRRRAVPDQPASRLLRGRGRPRDDAEATHRQHSRRAALRRQQVPPAARDRRRRQHERGRHLPEGGHHRRSCSP